MKTPASNDVRRISIVSLATVSLIAILWWAISSANRIEAPSEAARNHPSAEVVTAISKPPRPDANYAGSQVCSDCHQKIAERYNHSAMGRSLAKVAEASAPHEDYEQHASFNIGNLTYSVERKDDRVWHHEILTDSEGPIYDQSEEIQYAMGSNTRGRSYLLWRDGLMYVSPIAWYTKNGWDLSPGFTPGSHPRFNRRAMAPCLVCHCGHVVTEETRPHYFPQPVFHEIAIDCERCHGPSRAHVEYRQQPLTDEKDPILKVAQLHSFERDAVCYQCHFQGKSRFLRYGRAEDDFRPGMKISDVWTVFIEGTGINDDETAIVSQAMQMESSRCYQRSAGRMGCISCHDPHDSPEPHQLSQHYNRRCLECHANLGCSQTTALQQAAPANGSCIYCHMPALQAKQVAHTSQTDHRVLRRHGERTQSLRRSEWAIFEDGIANLSAAERAHTVGIMLAQNMAGQQDRSKVEECRKLLLFARMSMPDDEELVRSLADIDSLSGRTRDAEKLWKQSLEQNPDDEWSLFKLSTAAHNGGRYAEADLLFSRCMEINPRQPMAHFRWASTLTNLNKFDQAISEAHRALALDPTLVPIYFWLADVYEARGDSEKSASFKRLADRLSKSIAPKNH